MGEKYLILENGAVFKGQSFGYEAEAIGELVFTTDMTGYMETLADPSYYGQIVLQTFPLIGNFGVIPADFGSGPVHLKAYIVRQWCQEPSNFRSEGNLDSFLCDMKIPGLAGIDTRRLTRTLRDNGVMNAMISKTPELSDAQWAELRGYRITGAIAAVCGDARRKAPQSRQLEAILDKIKAEGESGVPGIKIALWDFGGAFRLAEGLVEQGCWPLVFGYDEDVDNIHSLNPDGIVLSGGPGDPAENIRIIEKIKKLCGSGTPILGVGLGHQMLALACGAKTEKLPFGHRGANQPVSDIESGRVFVTSQNHGYTVVVDSLPDNALMRYSNLSDGSCEGIDYKDIPAFSVQFDPTQEVFARFVGNITKGIR